MTEPLVVFDNVVKRFADFEAVKRMNFEIREGEFLAFMGPSGCGKTTTLRMLAGLERPSEGDIRLAGKSLVDVKPHERDTPMVWQSLALFPFLNARENVEFGLKMRGIDKEKRRRKALDWLERLGIGEFAERDVNSLSGGQRQRLEIARALVRNPRILVMDEATSALDPVTEQRIDEAIRRRGITCLVIAHRLSTIRDCDEIIVLNQGKVVERGTHDDLMALGGHYAALIGSA